MSISGIQKFQSYKVSNGLSVPVFNFKGQKKDIPSVNLENQPDSVTFSSKSTSPIKDKDAPVQTQKELFSQIEAYVDELYLNHPYNLKDHDSQNLTPIEDALKNIVKMVVTAEKKGTVIEPEKLAELFVSLAEKPARIKKDLVDCMQVGIVEQAFAHDYLLKRNLKNISNLIKRTPVKPDETTASYLKRINSANTKRNKQLEKGRIDSIKLKLKYTTDDVGSEKLIEMTKAEKKALIEEINAYIERHESCCHKLSSKSSMKEMISTLQEVYLGGFTVSNDDIEALRAFEAVLQRIGRYSSEAPFKELKPCDFIEVVDKSYKSDFNPEPVYRWLEINNPNSFIDRFPKAGEIYSYPRCQSCSIHKEYAEDFFNDAVDYLNVKFVIHPKSKTSKAYNLGVGQEVIYMPDVKFKILDRTLVEDIIKPKNNSKEKPKSVCRWEIHMQEI